MKNKRYLLLLIISLVQFNCTKSNEDFDATGVFESTEVIVSAETAGKILNFNLHEGDDLTAKQIVGNIDCENLNLQKKQIEASETALNSKTNSAGPQISIYKSQMLSQQKQWATQKQQLLVLQKEQNRMERLVKAEAAPSKQLDDINGQIEILQKQMDATESVLAVTKQQIASQIEMIGIGNNAILSEKKPLEERKAQMENQIEKCQIMNPINGTVLVKYAETDEITAPGKALYKIADLKQMILRAYITGSQLSEIKTNQGVKVKIDHGKNDFAELAGKIIWISDKAEFTPKTIQTKDERENLVYAIKVLVPNNGMLKIGMYGALNFK